ASTLRKLLGQAVSIEDGPTIVRYPKGSVPPDIRAEETADGLEVLFHSSGKGKNILVVAVGAMAGQAVALSKELAARGQAVKCVDPGWVIPIPPALLKQVAAADLVVTIEDGEVTNGVGALLRTTCAAKNCFTPIKSFGIPQMFLPTDSRDNLLESSQMTPAEMLKELAELLD
ncbi:transketolase C-terminal domain-containing protein, partial [Varibaculum cambriense]